MNHSESRNRRVCKKQNGGVNKRVDEYISHTVTSQIGVEEKQLPRFKR